MYKYSSSCDTLLQCKVGFAGDGIVCGVDTDVDGIPDKGLSCEGKSCAKVRKPYFIRI